MYRPCSHQYDSLRVRRAVNTTQGQKMLNNNVVQIDPSTISAEEKKTNLVAVAGLGGEDAGLLAHQVHLQDAVLLLQLVDQLGDVLLQKVDLVALARVVALHAHHLLQQRVALPAVAARPCPKKKPNQIKPNHIRTTFNVFC